MAIKPNRLTKFDWRLIVVFIALAVVFVVPKIQFPQLRAEPIADLFNPTSGDHVGFLLKIDPKYHFDDGTVRDGWLVRGLEGIAAWFPAEKQKKVQVVRR